MQDKILLKIAGVISIVIGVLCSITIIGLIIGIPLIMGGNRLKKISEQSWPDSSSDREAILMWTIIFFFINQISFVFSLIYYLQLESSSAKEYDNDKYANLERIKKLYDENVFTKEEYQKEKEKILNK